MTAETSPNATANLRARALTELKNRHLDEYWSIEDRLADEAGVTLPKRRLVGEAKARRELEDLIEKHPELAKELVKNKETPA